MLLGSPSIHNMLVYSHSVHYTFPVLCVEHRSEPDLVLLLRDLPDKYGQGHRHHCVLSTAVEEKWVARAGIPEECTFELDTGRIN